MKRLSSFFKQERGSQARDIKMVSKQEARDMEVSPNGYDLLALFSLSSF
jgi:hypothetical protein